MSEAGELESPGVMRERWKPQAMDSAAALVLLGKSAEVSPVDVIAFIYPSMEAAEAFKRSNLERNGCPTIGIADTERGVIGVVDLRPQLAELRRRRPGRRPAPFRDAYPGTRGP